MKTSYKILLTAFSAYLLFTIADTILIYRNYEAAKDDIETVFRQLEQIKVQVLIVESERHFVAEIGNRKDKQTLYFHQWGTFNPEGIRFSNDTLYLQNPPQGNAYLPHLKSFFLNGEPQSIEQ